MRTIARVAIVACLGALVACGVPSDRGPRAIPQRDVPFDLLAAPTTSPPTTQFQAREIVPIYLIGSGRLALVTREVQPPASLLRIVQALLAGPTADESGSGLRTAITGQTNVLSIRVQETIATIDLSGGFADIGGREQILALAQLVYTTTARPAVRGVRLSLDGRVVEVPRGDGTLTQEPLRREDFGTLAPL